MMNVWAPLQRLITFAWSCASLTITAKRGIEGYRDSVQDVLGDVPAGQSSGWN
jgi:cellobiose phosphorylase